VELIATADGAQVLLVHDEARCWGPPCCVHSPSAHPLRHRTLRWRADRRVMERVCEHGVGHPDPDDLGVRFVPGDAVHDCDGCCLGEEART
jgi:hypothetical protein